MAAKQTGQRSFWQNKDYCPSHVQIWTEYFSNQMAFEEIQNIHFTLERLFFE